MLLEIIIFILINDFRILSKVILIKIGSNARLFFHKNLNLSAFDFIYS